MPVLFLSSGRWDRVSFQMQDVTQVPCGMEDFIGLSRLLLEQNASLRFQAYGHSMYPTIRHGDIILVEPAKQVKVGDVAFFRITRGRVIAHRVMGTVFRDGQRFFQTKGDASRKPDGLVSDKQLLGKVVRVERAKGGRRKEVRLDGALGRWTGLLWARFPFCGYWVYRFLAMIKRYLVRLWIVREPKPRYAERGDTNV